MARGLHEITFYLTNSTLRQYNISNHKNDNQIIDFFTHNKITKITYVYGTKHRDLKNPTLLKLKKLLNIDESFDQRDRFSNNEIAIKELELNNLNIFNVYQNEFDILEILDHLDRLENTNLENTNLENTNLENTNLENTNLETPEKELEETTIEETSYSQKLYLEDILDSEDNESKVINLIESEENQNIYINSQKETGLCIG